MRIKKAERRIVAHFYAAAATLKRHKETIFDTFPTPANYSSARPICNRGCRLRRFALERTRCVRCSCVRFAPRFVERKRLVDKFGEPFTTLGDPLNVAAKLFGYLAIERGVQEFGRQLDAVSMTPHEVDKSEYLPPMQVCLRELPMQVLDLAQQRLALDGRRGPLVIEFTHSDHPLSRVG
jgi:hypothetical protein